MRDISLLVVHAAATPPTMDIGAAEIRDWHVNDRGWSDIGYHFVIRRDGVLEHGRNVVDVGAHVRGFNTASVGICLVGGVDDMGVPDCNYTAAQYKTLEHVLDYLSAKYPDARVCGHRDLDESKACPVFNVAAWWSNRGGAHV